MTAEKSSDESYQLKEMVRSVGTGLIREKLAQYIKELRQGTCNSRYRTLRQFCYLKKTLNPVYYIGNVWQLVIKSGLSVRPITY